MNAAQIPDINPGIVRTVQLLNDHGFVTNSSGDGVTKLYGCDPDFPFVQIESTAATLVEDCKKLVALFKIFGIDIVPQHPDLPSIQGSYDPVLDKADILVMYITDSMLRE